MSSRKSSISSTHCQPARCLCSALHRALQCLTGRATLSHSLCGDTHKSTRRSISARRAQLARRQRHGGATSIANRRSSTRCSSAQRHEACARACRLGRAGFKDVCSVHPLGTLEASVSSGLKHLTHAPPLLNHDWQVDSHIGASGGRAPCWQRIFRTWRMNVGIARTPKRAIAGTTADFKESQLCATTWALFLTYVAWRLTTDSCRIQRNAAACRRDVHVETPPKEHAEDRPPWQSTESATNLWRRITRPNARLRA